MVLYHEVNDTSDLETALKELSINNLSIKARIGSVMFNFILNCGFIGPYEIAGTGNHNHATFEIHYIIEGTGILNADGKNFHLSPDTYYVMAPNIYHGHFHAKTTANIVKKYVFTLGYETIYTNDPAFPEEEGKRIVEALESITVFYKKGIGNHIIIIKKICEELQTQRIGYYSRLQALFSILISEIARDIVSNGKADYCVPTRPPGEKQTLIIDYFFEMGYHLPVKANNLAKLLHVSERQLNRIMQEHYQMTFREKLLEMRMEATKAFLQYTDLPIKDIAAQVGYESESNFYTTFKQKYGCTPWEYRRNSATD